MAFVLNLAPVTPKMVQAFEAASPTLAMKAGVATTPQPNPAPSTVPTLVKDAAYAALALGAGFLGYKLLKR